MTTPSLPKSALETLRTVEFKFAVRGYKTDEVDEYLERVTIEVDALRDQLRQASDRLRQAAEHIAQLEAKNREIQAAPPATPEPAPTPATVPVQAAAPTPSSEDIAAETQRTLLMAQRFVEQTEREATETAAKTVAEAEAMARQITVEAELRVREEVGRLESVKNELASEIDGLATQLDAERLRLTGQLQEVLRWIDEHVQPSAAIKNSRQIAVPAPVEADPAPEAAIFQLGTSEGDNTAP